MNRHMMIDLETLSTDSNAVVSAIGAVIFDMDTREVVSKYYKVLSFEDQLKLGRNVNEDTLKWWFKQSKEASEIYTTDNKTPTSVALNELHSFMVENSDVRNLRVWGNGPSFDLTILETLMNDFRIKPPYSFRNVRCLRTFKEFLTKDKKVERVGIHHNALDDCLYQINVVLAGLE
jgi:hypothetical protein